MSAIRHYHVQGALKGVDLDHVVEQTQEVQLWKMQSRCLNLEKDDEEHGNFV